MASRPQAHSLNEKERQDALAAMDLVKIIRSYILAIVSAPGYKALICDKETMRVACTLLGRTELGEHGVVLIERLETESKKDHQELKGMFFLRPTRENITLLKKELKAPRFGSYNIYFSNLATPIFLQELAEADAAREQVAEVHEFYGDFVVIDPHHFTIPCPKNELLLCPKVALPDQIDRFVQGLSSVFLSIRRRPVIRYQRGSDNTQRLAEGLYRLTYKEQYSVFDFGSRSNPIVLILDRKDDPVTPLLTQWTYQAMIHELIGLNDGTARLKSAKLTDEESRNIVLDPSQDDFYRKHVFSNYGEVGVDVKALLDQFASKNEKHKQVESLEDMKRFISEHLDFTKLQGNVTKHVNIMSEVAEAISKRGLMEVSMAEQELANPEANLTASASYEEIMQLLRQSGTNDKDKIRLVMLYSLRFETEIIRIQALLDFLSTTAGVKERSPMLFAALEAVLMHAGGTKRAGDLYATRSALSRARSVFRGLKGVENVYTQHTPLLSATLSMISLDRLEPSSYPYMAGSQDENAGYQAAFKRTPPREVIVFIVGGSTYEESKCVRDWNERNPHMRVILGGSTVLNSDMFLTGLAGFEHKDEAEELL